MKRIRTHSIPVLILVLASAAACQRPADNASAGAEPAADTAGAMAAAATATAQHCVPQQSTEGRASPYDSTTVRIGDATALVCYSRPMRRGRTIMDSLVPYGELWRTGANEPTIIHTPVPLTIAGVAVPAGSYSLYTIPTAGDWTVIVNRSIEQWGEEGGYTAEIEAQEAGRGTVPSEHLEEPIEQFTIRTEGATDDAVDLILEWENTRVRIPIARGA